jgi:hypothetical protein
VKIGSRQKSASTIAILFVLLVAADAASDWRATSILCSLISEYGQRQAEISEIKLRAYDAVWAHLLGVADNSEVGSLGQASRQSQPLSPILPLSWT